MLWVHKPAGSGEGQRGNTESHLRDEMVSVIRLALHGSSDRCYGQGEADHRVMRAVIIRME